MKYINVLAMIPAMKVYVENLAIGSNPRMSYQFMTNSLRPRPNRRHFADDIFKCIFLNENVWIPIKISLKFVLEGPINNIPALVQIMAWRRPGDKPLSELMMVRLLTHICVTRPQWVKIMWTLTLFQLWFWWAHNFSYVTTVTWSDDYCSCKSLDHDLIK